MRLKLRAHGGRVQATMQGCNFLWSFMSSNTFSIWVTPYQPLSLIAVFEIDNSVVPSYLLALLWLCSTTIQKHKFSSLSQIVTHDTWSCVIINFYNFPCKSSKLTKLHESKYLFVNSILLILLIEGNLGRRTNQGLASWQRQEKQKQRSLTYTYWKKSTKARKPRMQMLPAMKKKLA